MIVNCLGVNLIILLSTHMPSSPGDISYHHNMRNLGTMVPYVTLDVIKLLSACVITLFYFLCNFISLKVTCVTFDTNLSL